MQKQHHMNDMSLLSAAEIIEQLELSPHPEGGYFRETFRDSTLIAGRSMSTAIYYLLQAGEVSRWHRIDTAEIWHWYAGAALELSIYNASTHACQILDLGNTFKDNQQPQVIVPAHHWQSAYTKGEWTLVGCTVAPGFEFARFELAPEGWQPVLAEKH